jgi:hypothetical protein
MEKHHLIDFFQNFKSLQVLDLSYNILGDIDLLLSEFEKNEIKLKKLFLGGCGLSE